MSPWYYHQRFLVFGLLYGASFFFGFLIAGLTGVPTVPCYGVTPQPALFAALAIVAAAGGWALRVWGASYLTSAVVWEHDPLSPLLRVAGPYRFTRNPLYLGNILQALGVGLVCPWTVLVVLLAGMIAYNYALIAVEERLLKQTQGAGYTRYLATVPRLVPLPWRVAPAVSQPSSLAEAVRAEWWTALPALAVVAVVIVRR